MFKKRLPAYIIDILIVSIILYFISLLIPTSSNLNNLNNELLEINNNFIKGELGIRTYLNQYATIFYSMDKELFLTSLINVFICIIYFVVIPLYNNGQTIGKKKLGIKIVSKDDKDATANSLILRYLMIDGIGVSILSMCSLFIINGLNYLIITSILNFLQFLVVVISIFMVLYRHDFKSLPDLIAGTKVIEVKKWKNIVNKN